MDNSVILMQIWTLLLLLIITGQTSIWKASPRHAQEKKNSKTLNTGKRIEPSEMSERKWNEEVLKTRP